MLLQSQPLSREASKKLGLDDEQSEKSLESKIVSQHIGSMFDNALHRKHKIHIKTRLGWIWNDIRYFFYDMKYLFRNHFVWFKTISRIRPWEGHDGLISVMIMHLRDYINTEEKYGHAEEEYKKQKIATATETLQLLERMKDPDDYYDRRRTEVEKRYPEYKYLVTEYENGNTEYSGDFVQQGKGWTGKEAGLNPREGYFEFVNGRFELATSPDRRETKRLLAELAKYHKEIHNAYKQAVADSEKDFERLWELLKENLYSWWD